MPLDNPVLDGTQFHRIVLLFVSGGDFQYILIDFPQPGRYRHQFRRPQFGWDLAGDSLYLFVDKLAGIQCRDIFLEDDRHKRKTEPRHGTDLFNIHDVAHRNLDRQRDELLHFLRSQCRRDRHDLHLVVGDIRDSIDRERQHRIDSSDQQEQCRQPHKQLLPDGKTDNSFKHIFFD